jgi:DNA-binding transcriptional MerR regulator
VSTGTNGEVGGAEESSRRSGKSESAFRTISEVSNELNVPQHVLRFWETKFSQIRPMKRGGGRRYYRPEDVTLLAAIRDLLYNDGYTIKGAQKLLRENGIKSVISHTEGEREGGSPGVVDDREPTFAFVGDAPVDAPSPHVEDPADAEVGVEVEEEEAKEDSAVSPGLSDALTPPEPEPDPLTLSERETPEALQGETSSLGPVPESVAESAAPKSEPQNELPKAAVDGADGSLLPQPFYLEKGEEGDGPVMAGLSDDQRLELEVVLSDLKDLRRILRQVDL